MGKEKQKLNNFALPVNITDNLILKFLIAIPMILIVFIAVYKLIGYVFMKKGLSGNES